MNPTPRTCRRCGAPFVGVSAFAHQKRYCSERCKKQEFHSRHRDRLLSEKRAKHLADPSKDVARGKRYRAENAETISLRRRRKHYGVDLKEQREMFDAQGGACAACASPLKLQGGSKIETAQLDHDHETGKVRAFLCLNCNMMIGYAKDSPEALRAAAEYLERFEVSR